MKLNPHPAKPVRLITTHEGKFLNLDDMIRRLKDDGVIDELLAHLKVGHDRGDDYRQVMRVVVGAFLAECGDVDLTPSAHGE